MQEAVSDFWARTNILGVAGNLQGSWISLVVFVIGGSAGSRVRDGM